MIMKTIMKMIMKTIMTTLNYKSEQSLMTTTIKSFVAYFFP